LAAKAPPYSSLPASAAPKRLPVSHLAATWPRQSVVKCLKPPLARIITWDRTPLGLETAAPGQPRAALAVEGSEKRWNFECLKILRCTGRLNATQPGV
jgi:hypothetical protein